MVLWDFDLLWKNFGTMEKTMVRCTKTMARWKKNYGTIPRTMELFTMENMVDNQKLRNFDL